VDHESQLVFTTLEVPKSMSDRVNSARELYHAFAAGDRDVVDGILADKFTFWSPVDVGLDRAGYFERCWPGAGQGQQFEFVRLVESGEEVIVTYEMTRRDGGRGRNTEVLTFDGDRITGAEVYFGWTL
jgi:ketosteroid isomerase-like protein